MLIKYVLVSDHDKDMWFDMKDQIDLDFQAKCPFPTHWERWIYGRDKYGDYLSFRIDLRKERQ